MSQSEPVGNTSATGPSFKELKWNTQFYRCVFTYNIPEPNSPSPEDVYNLLKEKCKKFEFQLEQGESGNWHYQGWFSLINKEYLRTIINLFPVMHIEPMKDYFASIKYCTKKDNTFREGPWNEKSIFLKYIVPDKEWQQQLLVELMLEPNPRKVIWYVDIKGGLGKSSFAKYMKIKHNAMVIRNGRTTDIAYMYTDAKVVIVDLSRSMENKFNYEILEQLKDGMLLSAKYESCFKCFNSPHVIVFSNWYPDYDKLSKDRWDVRELA